MARTRGARPTRRPRAGQVSPVDAVAATPAPAGGGDVWAYMGMGAGAGKSMVRVGPVAGDPAAVLPPGAVAWAREGDKSWTEVGA